MAKLRSKGQRIVAGVTNPAAVYSRVVSMAQSLPRPAADMYCYTEALAQSLWLLSIDVWIFGQPPLGADAWSFSLYRGFQMPTSTAQVQAWEDILPLVSPVGLWRWHGYSTPYHMRWELKKLLTGQSQRFGAAFNITGPIVSYFQASFEISEG